MQGSVIAVVLAFAAGTSLADAVSPQRPLRQLQFSRNGQYVLAQDDSEITILRAEPLSILFRIPAESAGVAKFTPDSRQVVFISSGTKVDSQQIAFRESGPHVERWTITDQSRIRSPALPPTACGTQELSPDGEVLVCLDLEGTLFLFDIASGERIFEKKQFEVLNHSYPSPESNLPVTYWGHLGQALIEFSPDGRYVVVQPRWADGPTLILDTSDQKPVRLIGSLKKLHDRWFAWIAPGQILVEHGYLSDREKKQGFASGIVVEFPSGRIASEPKIPNGMVFRAADPGFIIVRQFGGGYQGVRTGNGGALIWLPSSRSAAAELSTGQVIISQTPALDVFGKFYVAQPAEDKVGLYEIGKGLRETVELHKK